MKTNITLQPVSTTLMQPFIIYTLIKHYEWVCFYITKSRRNEKFDLSVDIYYKLFHLCAIIYYNNFHSLIFVPLLFDCWKCNSQPLKWFFNFNIHCTLMYTTISLPLLCKFKYSYNIIPILHRLWRLIFHCFPRSSFFKSHERNWNLFLFSFFLLFIFLHLLLLVELHFWYCDMYNLSKDFHLTSLPTLGSIYFVIYLNLFIYLRLKSNWSLYRINLCTILTMAIKLNIFLHRY